MKRNSNQSSNKNRTPPEFRTTAMAPRVPAAIAKRPTKQQLVVDLLVRDRGATLSEIIAATGWLAHTTRAALTVLKKQGYALSSTKLDGVRTYRAVVPQ